MQNFNEKHPHVIENVGCRCKICEGSIFKSQIRQDADEIYMMDRLKSICKFKESFRHCSTYFDHSTPQSKKKTMQSSELESGLTDEAELEECIVFA